MKSDFLKTPGNKEVFKVPENYFEDFQTRMEARIDAEESAQKDLGKKVLFQRMRPVLNIAASLIILFFCIQFIVNKSNDRKDAYSQLENLEDFNVESMTAEDILMSSLDEYSLMYYYLYENE